MMIIKVSAQTYLIIPGIIIKPIGMNVRSVGKRRLNNHPLSQILKSTSPTTTPPHPMPSPPAWGGVAALALD